MSDTSTIAASSGLTQMMQMQMQQRPPEPPLKDQVDGMSEEDKTEFDSKIESFSPEQMMYFMSMMLENESEISEKSQEEATAAIFEIIDEAGSIESLSEVEGLSALEALEDGAPPPPPGGMPPPPPAGETQDPLASLTEENMNEFMEMINSMTNEQKQEFGFLLMDSKEELATLDSEEAAEKVLSLLEKASTTTTNASTQNAMSNFTGGGSFLDIYS